jgi:endoglucanase
LAIVVNLVAIGLIHTHFDDVVFTISWGVGGLYPMILGGLRVVLLTRVGSGLGVVGKKPIHLLRHEEPKKVPEIRDLHLDIGAPDGDAATAAVRIGDVAVIAGDPVEVMGDRVISRSMDNRLGSYIALEAARLVAEDGGAPGDVAALGVVQEEITFAGARTSAFALQPDVAIAVDVTHATDAPGIDVKQEGKHEFGGGAVIERGSTLHPMVFEMLHDAAEREGIPFTVAASARGTGTDADAIHFSRAGVPTGLVSIALRYMHSRVEMVQLSVIDACARLIAAFATSLSPETKFVR